MSPHRLHLVKPKLTTEMIVAGWQHVGTDLEMGRNDALTALYLAMKSLDPEIVRMRDALEEISLGAGEFNRDPLKHAENTIDHMKSVALEALSESRAEQVQA